MNAQLLITTIDIVYDTIMDITMRCVNAYVHADEEGALMKEKEGGKEGGGHNRGEAAVVPAHTTPPPTFKTVHDILHVDITSVPVPVSARDVHHAVMYAGTVHVPLYMHPTIEFDTQIAEIPYGEMVMMLETRGRFCKVAWRTHEGWVLRDDVVDRAVRVHPQFTIGEENSIDHPNTAHVRAILDDPFGLGRSEFPLQASEYILYKLWKKHVLITWPETRPRVPGLWHKILKGVPGVHIGVVPKVGSIMEYLFSGGDAGHLAYVEAVFPDNTITISETNYPDSGIYNERELTKEEWRELKPVFITVS